jgi:hypothetical protein
MMNLKLLKIKKSKSGRIEVNQLVLLVAAFFGALIIIIVLITMGSQIKDAVLGIFGLR